MPKTNKRFLSSIIRSTDDHNKTILRAQAQAAAAAGLITALLILVSFSKIFKSSMLYLVIAARISH